MTPTLAEVVITPPPPVILWQVVSQPFSFFKSTSSRQSVIFFTSQSHFFTWLTPGTICIVCYKLMGKLSNFVLWIHLVSRASTWQKSCLFSPLLLFIRLQWEFGRGFDSLECSLVFRAFIRLPVTIVGFQPLKISLQMFFLCDIQSNSRLIGRPNSSSMLSALQWLHMNINIASHLERDNPWYIGN